MIKLILTIVIFFVQLNTTLAQEVRCDREINITYYKNPKILLNEFSSFPERKSQVAINASNKAEKIVDEYWNHIGPEKHLYELNTVLNKYSIITENFEKNGEFEFLFNNNGKLQATNFTNCKTENLYWEYQTQPYNGTFSIYTGSKDTNEYLIRFGIQGSHSQNHYRLNYYRKGSQNCYNSMNPICHKHLAELRILGYADLESNLKFDDLKNIVKTEWERAKKITEEAYAKQLAQEKADRDRAQNEKEARVKAERERIEAEKAKRLRLIKEKDEFDSSPYGQLYNSYSSYLMISDLYDARKEFATPYITQTKMSEVKKKMREIENKMISEQKLDTDMIWTNAEKSYQAEFSTSMELIKSSGIYSNEANSMSKIQLITFDAIHKDVVGFKSIEKDF